jgi:outer membrane protein insertion porin family
VETSIICEDVRLNDRFFRGGNSFRGFDTAGVGPRDLFTGDALGGRAFAIGSFELSFPTGLPEDLGISASLFADFGAVGILKAEDVDNASTLGFVNANAANRGDNLTCTGANIDIPTSSTNPALVNVPTCVVSDVFDDEMSLRASAGLSVFWDSPFGPVRFDLAHTFLKEDYDEAKAFRFTAGTRF